MVKRKRFEWLTLGFMFFSAVIFLFFLLPIVNVIIQNPISVLVETIMDKEVQASIFMSFLSATITTIITVMLGTPLAYLLAKKEFREKSFIDSLIDLPVLIPHTVAGIALLTILAPNTFIGRPLSELGIRFLDTVFGIVAAQTFVSAPLYIKTVKEVFADVDPSLEKAARTLGASPSKVFAKVDLPLAERGMLTGAILCWARAISEFGAVIILAYYPYTAPVLIFVRFMSEGLAASRPIAAWLMMLTFAIFACLKALQREH